VEAAVPVPDPADESLSSESSDDVRAQVSAPSGEPDSLHATPEDMSGYARRRAAINEMRRKACFRLAELSRPVEGAAERGTLTLPASEPAQEKPTIRITKRFDLDEEAPAQETKATPSAEPAPRVSEALEDPLPRMKAKSAPAPGPEEEELETPSWLMRGHQVNDGATTLGLLLIDFAESNIRRHLDLARALLTAKSLDEAIERHDSYMKSSLTIFEEQAAELQLLTERDGK
jgi:hypothetical protein